MEQQQTMMNEDYRRGSKMNMTIQNEGNGGKFAVAGAGSSTLSPTLTTCSFGNETEQIKIQEATL